jgi:hypothetical protein
MELAIKVSVITTNRLVEVVLQDKANRLEIFDSVIHQASNGSLKTWG